MVFFLPSCYIQTEQRNKIAFLQRPYNLYRPLVQNDFSEKSRLKKFLKLSGNFVRFFLFSTLYIQKPLKEVFPMQSFASRKAEAKFYRK